MLVFEIKTETVFDENSKENVINKYLSINGVSDPDSSFYEKDRYATFYSDEITDVIKTFKFSEVAQHISNFQIKEYVEALDEWCDVNVCCSKYYKKIVPSVNLEINLNDLENWNRPYSIAQLAEELKLNLSASNRDDVKFYQEDEDGFLNGYGIAKTSNDLNANIGDEVHNLLIAAESIIDLTVKNLISKLNSDSILTYFHFPDEIKSACNQYLMYFTQFLADSGITADTEIKENVRETLFTVIPHDKTDSLEKIKKALNVYLSIPSNPNFASEAASQTDIAVTQLQANVMHLQSQLLIAKSVYQMNQATIDSLQLTNFQLKHSLETSNEKLKNDEEELVKGVVSVTKVEGTGFVINLPEILRALKRRFGRRNSQ